MGKKFAVKKLFPEFCFHKYYPIMNKKMIIKKGQKKAKKVIKNNIDHLIKKNELQNQLLKKIIRNINEDKH